MSRCSSSITDELKASMEKYKEERKQLEMRGMVLTRVREGRGGCVCVCVCVCACVCVCVCVWCVCAYSLQSDDTSSLPSLQVKLLQLCLVVCRFISLLSSSLHCPSSSTGRSACSSALAGCQRRPSRLPSVGILYRLLR